jgi:16S rRNA (guanine966-N2)-methyltransferase
MTRIIGGLVGSRKLASPAKSTRPTSDRIRESIFSSLESKGALQKRSVLDLSPNGYELLDTKNFGDTAVYWLKPN